MKLYLSVLLLFCIHIAHTQTRESNKTLQVEQLQLVKQLVNRQIDSLHFQLAEQTTTIDDTRQKLEQLKKESNAADKPDISAKDQELKLSDQLSAASNKLIILQEKYNQRMAILNKAMNLQKELEEKIMSLVRDSNR